MLNVPGISHNLDVRVPAAASISASDHSATIAPRAMAGPGPPSASRPQKPPGWGEEGGPPASGPPTRTRSVRSPPLPSRLPDGTSQYTQQQQEPQHQLAFGQQNGGQQQLPNSSFGGSNGQQSHVHFGHHRARSANRQQQQEQHPQVLSQIPAKSTSFLGRVSEGGNRSESCYETGAAAACDAAAADCDNNVHTWRDDPSLAQCDSVSCSPLPRFGGHPLFPKAVPVPAAVLSIAAVAAASAAVAGPAGLGLEPTGGSPPLQGTTLTVDYRSEAGFPSGGKVRNNSQVLLPPLLMRAPGQEGGERQTIFFGPGALPGLLVGSSAHETGDGLDGMRTGNTRALAGPMFLHVAPSIRSRQQVSGMVPSVVPCRSNDGDESASLWDAPSSPSSPAPDIDSAGNRLRCPMPSSAALLMSYRTYGMGGCTPVAVDTNPATAAVSGGTGEGAPAASAAVHGNATAQQQQQQEDCVPVPSNVSLAQLQPFHTAAQVPLELETATGRLEADAAPRASGGLIVVGTSGGGGSSCGGGGGGGTRLNDAGGEGDTQMATFAGGWLSSADLGGTSRRYCRGVSMHDNKAAGAGGCFMGSKERGGSSCGQGPAAAQGGSGGGADSGGSAYMSAGTSIAAIAAAYGSVPAPPPLKAALVRPLSANDVCGKGGDGGGGTVTSTVAYGDPEAEMPLARWQRAARAAGLTASIARSFRTLRNQHDENLVREDQLEVVGEIGAGSFARVSKCLYKPPDGGKPFLVAVKRIKTEMLSSTRDSEDLHLFIQEAQLLRKLNHPHIVKYIGLGVVLEEAPTRGGGGGGGGGEGDKLLGAEQLLALSRRSWGAPSARQQRNSLGAASRKLSKRESAKRLAAGGGVFGGDGRSVDKSLYGSDDTGPHPLLPAPVLRGVFIVEEFLGGGTLKGAVYQQMLRPQKQLYSNATALRWMAQVASALSYMHTSRPKVLHRDIKLDNVLLHRSKGKDSSDMSYEGSIAKLGDLGLAALLAHHRRASGIGASDLEMEECPPGRAANGRRLLTQSSCAVRQRVTAATMAPPHLRHAKDATQLSKMLESHKRERLGTYMYMAPEVYQRQKYDEKCDCFSFAMLLYEVFHRYITACSLEHAAQMEKYARQVSLGFRPAIHEDLPAPLRRVIKQCWAQEPEQRPDMAAVARELWTMEERGVLAALDLKQQQASDLLGDCCCVVS
ncbi:hypothetical protein VaNZ11_014949 [Volvox africanus]|uniref:Protein kinase domain-containing protein n=1 Tax=Volvox africanus TaxID=51714 RepID=A0ABQ5SJJ2_9CHLO|nr:hypothetical protein VaNZ11_014949 [Volvox africanus]